MGSRVGASLLKVPCFLIQYDCLVALFFQPQAVSIPELLVRSPEDYLQTLLRLIENPLRIQKLRMTLWNSECASSITLFFF